MTKISETYNLGDEADLNLEEILLRIQEMYRDLAVAINRKPDVYTRQTDGVTSETFLSNGDININLSTNKVEMLTNHAASTVTWTTL